MAGSALARRCEQERALRLRGHVGAGEPAARDDGKLEVVVPHHVVLAHTLEVLEDLPRAGEHGIGPALRPLFGEGPIQLDEAVVFRSVLPDRLAAQSLLVACLARRAELP